MNRRSFVGSLSAAAAAAALPYFTPAERSEFDRHVAALNASNPPPFDAHWLEPTAPRTWRWDWKHQQLI
ncbi:MAG TPA: twin-arginine translocation signal domain-containing protein, partial [Gemmatimonadales bacterium]|nr:twin-arginine translocation signal domain-containing protein [Gemmatimonadales bacterium]